MNNSFFKKLSACFCNKKLSLWAVVAIALVVAMTSGKSHADNWQGIEVEVKGSGPAMIFIPGLNSGSQTFTDICDAIKSDYSCHLMHLPGFAGQAPDAKAQAAFLPSMRDSIKAYIADRKLEQPVLVGHSLGGVLSLMLAIDTPELAKALIIVDALPFYPALQNPQLTVADMKPQADMLKQQMLSLSDDVYQQNAAMALNGMSNREDRQPLLLTWSKTSDKSTTAQAMYDMMTTDLRSQLSSIKTPTLVLGAWAAYAGYGSTLEFTRGIYTTQYAQLSGVDIRMAQEAYHFITWDEPQWTVDNMRDFLRATAR